MNGARAVLVFGDETGFSLHPRLGRLWMKRGTRIQVPTKSQHPQRLNLFGWVEPLRGWYGFLPILKGNREGFLKFLHALHRRFMEWRIYLYVDKAKWHRGSEIDSFLAEERVVWGRTFKIRLSHFSMEGLLPTLAIYHDKYSMVYKFLWCPS